MDRRGEVKKKNTWREIAADESFHLINRLLDYSIGCLACALMIPTKFQRLSSSNNNYVHTLIYRTSMTKLSGDQKYHYRGICPAIPIPRLHLRGFRIEFA